MKNYAKVDHANRRIIMDRTFAKNAEIVGSPEYNQLQLCRRDYPAYAVERRVIKNNNNQERYRGLTYEFMEEYISSHEPPETVMDVLDELSDMIFISKGHSKGFGYPTIKRWFLHRYPEYAMFGSRSSARNSVLIVGDPKDAPKSA